MTQSFLPTQKSETESFIRFNRSILRHSGLRVILMCGRAVPGLVLPKEREETRLKLEAGESSRFLDIENNSIKRVFTLIPHPIDEFRL
jgi:hypothetical protein